MEYVAHIDALEREGIALGEAAATTGLTDPVPGCPEWTIRDLLGHVPLSAQPQRQQPDLAPPLGEERTEAGPGPITGPANLNSVHGAAP